MGFDSFGIGNELLISPRDHAKTKVTMRNSRFDVTSRVPTTFLSKKFKSLSKILYGSLYQLYYSVVFVLYVRVYNEMLGALLLI